MKLPHCLRSSSPGDAFGGRDHLVHGTHRGIDKQYSHSHPDTWDHPICPLLQWEVDAAVGTLFDFHYLVGRPERDIHMAAVGLRTWSAGRREVLVRIANATLQFFLSDGLSVTIL
jgi:hypothetical protein